MNESENLSGARSEPILLDGAPVMAGGDESMVPDDRGRMTPAQMVEQKLVSLLKTSPVLVSQIHSGARRTSR